MTLENWPCYIILPLKCSIKCTTWQNVNYTDHTEQWISKQWSENKARSFNRKETFFNIQLMAE